MNVNLPEPFMLPTYTAVLRDNRLEWNGEIPPGLTPEKPVGVLVTLLDPLAPLSRGERMAAALEKLAGSALAQIADPVDWQREQRLDRELPGRAD
jgi:hypothetical protein